MKLFLRLLAVILTTLSAAPTLAQTTRPATQPAMRFLVMGDPQFRLLHKGDPAAGYQWTSPTWARMPALMKQTQIQWFFVCGDLFQYEVGDGSTIPELWKVWDDYVQDFAGIGRVEWVVGGHEFWGGKTADEPRQYFLKHYPEHVRYTLTEGDDQFLLFDDVHDPNYFDDKGLEWLQKTLQASTAKRIWFFGHVPPRNTTAWWPQGSDAKPDLFRSKMAAILEKHKITAAFFGHEHQEGYLGNRGGFPMFVVGCRMPLLVEADADRVSYRWLLQSEADNPLQKTASAMQDLPITTWKLLALPKGEPLPANLADLDPTLPVRLSTGKEIAFQTVTEETGRINPSAAVPPIEGGKIIAVADYPLKKWAYREVRLRSDLPYAVWFNGQSFGSAPATEGRWNGYLMGLRKNGQNRAVLVLEPGDKNAHFTLIPSSFPPDLTVDP